MINYYPEVISIAAMKKNNPGWEIQDEDEIQRLQDIEDKKKRGKGAPKKAKSKGKHKNETPEERRARKERKREKKARREVTKSDGLKGVEALLRSLDNPRKHY